jgi:D-lactate dehydrogenase
MPCGSCGRGSTRRWPAPVRADTCVELSRLFDLYDYANSVIFGHAKDGNIHFMLTDRFEGAGPIGRYTRFTEDMVDLVLGHGGSLKAEHGTGRVMAPYVRRQYGDELYAVMVELKQLCDPHGLLNPGVLLSSDPDLHLKHIKLAPAVEAEVDRCVECGYCEPVCPSRDLTMTPRQRIVARRAIRSAELSGDVQLAGRLEAQYEYPGLQTCAVDGMCVTACPVLINTGDLVRRLRAQSQTTAESAVWTQAAKHWGLVSGGGSLALTVADHLPTALAPAVRAANELGRAVVGADRLPLWSPDLPPGGASRRRPPPVKPADAVYLPACVNRMFGPEHGADHPADAGGGGGVQGAFEQLCAAAGVTLLVPEGVDSLCCGTPWSSKGLPDGYAVMKDRVLPVVLAATRDGELPLVCDASSCTEGLLKMLGKAPEAKDVQVVDAMTFAVEHVLPRLEDRPKLKSITVHPTCSSTQLGINGALTTLAAAVAEQVHVPADWGCCAFAGDRGMLHPELTASATALPAAEVREFGAEAHASCNRTCELGLTRATGRTYRHVLELLAERQRP